MYKCQSTQREDTTQRSRAMTCLFSQSRLAISAVAKKQRMAYRFILYRKNHVLDNCIRDASVVFGVVTRCESKAHQLSSDPEMFQFFVGFPGRLVTRHSRRSGGSGGGGGDGGGARASRPRQPTQQHAVMIAWSSSLCSVD